MKKVLAAAALLLAAATLTSCGGGPPTDASKSEFCGVFQDFLDETATIDQNDTKGAADALRRVGSKLEEVGTPSNISDSARAGFEKVLELIDGLPDNPTEDDFNNLEEDLTASQKADSKAFDDYLNKECGDIEPTTTD